MKRNILLIKLEEVPKNIMNTELGMDINNPSVRKKAKKFQSNNDVDALFK